tara:strand:- start:342 stop:2630 length:2289 start_codon:yes stop_codon:yes gene_type:complete
MSNSIKNKKDINIKKNKTIKKIKGSNVIGQVRKRYKNMLALTNESERPNLYRLFSDSRIDKLKKMPDTKKSYDGFAKSIQDKYESFKQNNNSKPNNNFYDYVNYQWIEEQAKLSKDDPKYYVQIDSARISQDKVYRQLIDYTNSYIKENKGRKKAESINAVMNCISNANKKKGLEHCHRLKKQVDQFIFMEDMYGLLAYANQDEIFSWQAPIVWNIRADEKNVTKYISHLDSAQVGIYDWGIYYDYEWDTKKDTEMKKEYKEKYFEYIRKIFKTLLPNDWEKYDPQHVWDTEKQLIDAMMCEGIKESEDYYNVLTKKELEEKYGFNWTGFVNKLGKKVDPCGVYKETKDVYQNVPGKVVVGSLNTLMCTVKLLKENWTTPQWKTWWLFIFYRQMIRFDWDWNEIHFEFHEKFVKGQPVRFPKEIYSIWPLAFTYNTFLTSEYVSHHNNPVKEAYVKNMIEDFRYIYINKIKRNTWLSQSTKNMAIKKLENINIIVGVPERLREDPILNYIKDDPWYNMGLICANNRKEMISLEGKTVIDIPSVDWNNLGLIGSQAYVVNAYYQSTDNSIYFPLAYLQKPFIDLEQRGIEYNLAYVGYAIGHELSHCLDNTGSKYDEIGNLKNWWTKEDKAKYQKKIDDVIKQYEEYAKRDGIDFDASIGTGENLADISGLSLAEEYLFHFQLLNGDIAPIKKNSLEAFYIYSAQTWRQKIFDKALPAQLKQNPHPLDKYRCNCPLARLPLFREIYNVKEGDGMWWNNTDTIW